MFATGQHEKIKKLLDFYEITAEEVMVPRIKIDAIEHTMTVKDAIENLFEYSHSRIPVFAESIDQIEAVVTLKELLLEEKK